MRKVYREINVEDENFTSHSSKDLALPFFRHERKGAWGILRKSREVDEQGLGRGGGAPNNLQEMSKVCPVRTR